MLDLVFVPHPEFSKLPALGSPWEYASLQNLRSLASLGSLNLVNAEDDEDPEWGMNDCLFRHRYNLSFRYIVFDIPMVYS